MISGLTTANAEKLLKTNGFNEIPEKNSNFFIKLIHKLVSPISIMLLAASLLSLFIGKVFDFYFILILLFLNILITLWQEHKADNAIKKLNDNLEQKVRTLRDGKWKDVLSRNLVEGDVIELSGGDVVPADGIIVDAKHVFVNEAALTGESLPKDKKVNDEAHSGSFLVSGIAVIRVTATGGKTSFGKTVFLVERIRKKSLLEKDVVEISKFLTALSLTAVVVLSIVFFLQKAPLLELLTLDLSLIIAGVPVSLPTVMTLIIEFGVLALAKKNAIVRRLSALEDLANVNYLLTDKTGTLTKNEINVQDVYSYDKFTHNEVILFAYLATAKNDHDVIDTAIDNKARELQLIAKDYEVVDFIPADSSRKRSTTVIKNKSKTFTLSLGAPQIVAGFCKMSSGTKEKYDREVEALARRGFRSLALAMGRGSSSEKNMDLVGLIALSDTLRDDAKNVVSFLQDNGIGVAMVTGDNRAIAAQIATSLGLSSGKVVAKDALDKLNWDTVNGKFFQNTGAFAEILPEDKLKLVQKAKEFFVIASNGDGVNDLPAIKAANVGIAVKNSVNALKAAADIVLLSQGISVIKDAILESRKIFERVYTYSLYRISESLRLIVTIAFLGVIYRVYPLTPLQIILVALLNDIPIISLAFNKVSVANRPAKINVKKRFILSSLYGITGVANSLILFLIIKNVLNLPWSVIQTMYFLKLMVSGHMLIYVAHTKKRWWRFLPSKEVIWATSLTQLAATALAFTGFLMPGKLNILEIILLWGWAFFWMQVSEAVKFIEAKS